MKIFEIKINHYFVNMLDRMYVDRKELLVFEIDQDKSHIVKDFLNFQFYKHSSLLKKDEIYSDI